MEIGRKELVDLCCYGVSCSDCPMTRKEYGTNQCISHELTQEELRGIWEARPINERLRVFVRVCRNAGISPRDMIADVMRDITRLR